MADTNLSLPVRTEADADSRLQVKIVDSINPATKQMTVDSDGAAKVLATGRDSGGVNRPVLTSTSGQVRVIIDDKDADEVAVAEYNTGSSVASGASSTQTYSVPVGKTLLLKQIIFAGSGRTKAEIKAGAATLEASKAVNFGSAANPNCSIMFAEPIRVAAGENVLVVRSNLDLTAQDLYSTIIGTLI